MGKLFLLFSLFCLFSCNKEDSKTVFGGDLMFFTEIPVIPEEGGVYVEPITTKALDTETTGSWEWQVWCVQKPDLASYHASVLIDKTRSTAIEGVDFKLEGTNMVFGGEAGWAKNVKLDILSGKLSSPKTLVLKLDYGNEDLNPVESRVKNILTITLQ